MKFLQEINGNKVEIQILINGKNAHECQYEIRVFDNVLLEGKAELISKFSVDTMGNWVVNKENDFNPEYYEANKLINSIVDKIKEI